MIFKTIEEFRQYVNINANASLAMLEPFIDQARLEYMEPLFGSELYDALSAAYAAAPAAPLSAAYAALLPYVQRAQANYTLYRALPHMMTQIGSLGVQEQRSRDNTGEPARQWVVNEQRASYLIAGDAYAEAALKFLENNRVNYAVWTASAAFTESQSDFIKNSTQLSEVINCQNSRRFFLALRPFLRQAQEAYLVPCMGQSLYDSIVTQLRSGTVIFAKIALARKATAFLGLVMAIPHLQLVHTAQGLSVASNFDGIKSVGPANSAVEGPRLATLMSSCESQGMSALRQLKLWLDDNMADDELYSSQDPNQNPAYTIPDNTGSKSSFVV